MGNIPLKMKCKMSSMRFGLIMLLMIMTVFANAQTFVASTVTGRIVTTNNTAVEGASITIELKGKGTVTDKKGYFNLNDLEPGFYDIKVSAIGFKEQTVRIKVPTVNLVVVVLVAANDTLGEVTITAKNTTERLKNQVLKSIVIDAKAVQDQAATLSELINRAPGVRIRQSGGLGSSLDVSINGFSGRAVRYFKDGIPMDYLGNGYNLTNAPLNVVDHIEVFKGVLPISLGADALGGAINLSTRQADKSYAAVSYETGSFNTHRATFNGFYQSRNKWYAGVDGFYNYSDNDYKVTANVTDPATQNQYPDKVRLFHNGYKGYYMEGYLGVKNTDWADELKLAIATYRIDGDQQYSSLMTEPYGAITRMERSVVPTLRYRKSWLNKKLQLDQFIAYNQIRRERIDTTRGSYDWYGNFTSIPSRRGESRQASLAAIDIDLVTARTNIAYKINDNNKLELNYVISSSARKGEDPYGPKFADTNIDVLAPRALYTKQVLGLGWESKWMDGRLINILMAKGYRYLSEGVDAFLPREVHSTDVQRTTGNNWGAANAIKYLLTNNSFLRLSLEYANRLPEQDELFGDGVFQVSNFLLKPEESLNLSLGYRVATPRTVVEINTFYRRSENMILLVPVLSPYVQYQNMQNVRGWGVDADVSYRLTGRIRAQGNVSWQDLRLFGITNGLDAWKNGTLLRNTPYFFANAGLNAVYEKVVGGNDVLKPYIYYNFIREFYLETIAKATEPDGFLRLWGRAGVRTDLIIPNQHLLTAGFTYRPSLVPFTIGVEVKNITDAQIFDNYRVQRAGRSFHVKLNYLFN